MDHKKIIINVKIHIALLIFTTTELLTSIGLKLDQLTDFLSLETITIEETQIHLAIAYR